MEINVCRENICAMKVYVCTYSILQVAREPPSPGDIILSALSLPDCAFAGAIIITWAG